MRHLGVTSLRAAAEESMSMAKSYQAAAFAELEEQMAKERPIDEAYPWIVWTRLPMHTVRRKRQGDYQVPAWRLDCKSCGAHVEIRGRGEQPLRRQERFVERHIGCRRPRKRFRVTRLDRAPARAEAIESIEVWASNRRDAIEIARMFFEVPPGTSFAVKHLGRDGE